jgi:hypothetical protein
MRAELLHILVLSLLKENLPDSGSSVGHSLLSQLSANNDVTSEKKTFINATQAFPLLLTNNS